MFFRQPILTFFSVIFLVSSCKVKTENTALTYEAFHSLMQTLEFSANSLKENNDAYYGGIRSNFFDYRTREKVRVWEPHALRVQKLANEMIDFLKAIKQQLVIGTGVGHHFGVYSLSVEQLRMPSKRYTDRNILKEINDQLTVYIEKAHDTTDIPKQFIRYHVASLESNVISDTLLKQHERKFFDDLPFISMFTFLLKYEILVRSIEHNLVKQFFALTREYMYGTCEKTLPLIMIDKSFVKSGETIELTGGVASFNPYTRPIFTINQKKYKPGPDGTVSYKFKPTRSGKHSFLVQVEFEDDDGSITRMSKLVHYEVATDSIQREH